MESAGENLWLGRLTGSHCWPLMEHQNSQFAHVVRTCEEAVAQTSPRSMSSSPTVSYHGCLIGADIENRHPAVVIVSSSARYSNALMKKIRRSGILGRSTDFEVLSVSADFTAEHPSAPKVWRGRKWKWLPSSRPPPNRDSPDLEENKQPKPERDKTERKYIDPQDIKPKYTKPPPQDFESLRERVKKDAKRKKEDEEKRQQLAKEGVKP